MRFANIIESIGLELSHILISKQISKLNILLKNFDHSVNHNGYEDTIKQLNDYLKASVETDWYIKINGLDHKLN